MRRRDYCTNSLPTPSRPHSARRKPDWNAYLTDNTQYKLNQQQQLQRALQQLSTAHFSARSPATSASRRRLKAASNHSSAWSTPRDKEKRREQAARLEDVADTGELNTQRRLQFDVSMDLEETTPRRRAAEVSFQEDKMDREHKMTLQTELEVLEKMLWQLETETERCSKQSTPHRINKSPRVKTTVKEDENPEINVSLDRKEQHDKTDTEARLEDVCYKSLKIGLELARRVDSLKTEVESERRLRVDQELHTNVLTQEVRSTQAKCNYLEAKYQNMTIEVNCMRDAVIATEQAIHRMTVAFEYSQRRRAKTSNPSTPSKPVVSRPARVNNSILVSSKKSVTPKRRNKAVEQQENWKPNGQQGK